MLSKARAVDPRTIVRSNAIADWGITPWLAKLAVPICRAIAPFSQLSGTRAGEQCQPGTGAKRSTALTELRDDDAWLNDG